MTPAQEAKEYAAEHGFVLGTVPKLKRYTVRMLNKATGVADGDPIADVGSYPAALNAMKRYVAEHIDGATNAVFQFNGTVKRIVGSVTIDDAAQTLDVNPEVLQQQHASESDRMLSNNGGSYKFTWDTTPRNSHYRPPEAAQWKPRGPWCAVISYTDYSEEGEYFATRSDAVQDIRRAMSNRNLRRVIARVTIRYYPEYVR